MHPTLLQNPPFQLDYSPSSSESDCIGSQRPFSTSAAFPTDEDEQNQRIGSLGHSLSQPGPTPTTNGFRYRNQSSTLHDVRFPPPSSGLLVSPIDSCSGTSTSPVASHTLSYASVFSNDVNSADAILSNPSSVYSHPVGSSWTERMSDFRSPRIPTLLPSTSASLSTSLQSQGSSILSSSNVGGRDSYPNAYTLTRTPFASQTPGINEMSRYTFPNIPSGFGNPGEPSSTLYQHPNSLLLDPPSRTQPSADAPPFHETVNLHQILTTNNQRVKPHIQAKIHKGFFLVDGKWTCYRRNYFSVTCSFTLAPWTPNTTYYLENSYGEPIRSFAMSISAVVNAQDNEVRELVQHTPKRDKQSEKKPDKVVLHPQQHYVLGSNAGSTGAHTHSYYSMPSHSGGMSLDYNQQYANPIQSSQTPNQHTFERIQFQKATANNGKRRAQQQYYNLVVELHAEIARTDGSSQWMRIAKQLSDSMVVRGRSPGHYKDGRRDSSASMGPENGGPGSSGDVTRVHLPPNIGQVAYSQLPYMSYDSQRGGTHYTRQGPQHHQRSLGSTDQSSSTSPLISSSSSSPFEYTLFNDAMDGVEPIDGFPRVAPFQDLPVGLNSLDQKKSMSTTSRQSHLSSIDFGSHSDEDEEPDRTFDDTFESMIPSYHGDQEDNSQYVRPSTAVDRRPVAPVGHENSRATRPSETPYGRFDPVQNSLCT